MSALAIVGQEPEKDHWWLVGVSIAYQQVMFASALSMFLKAHIASPLLAMPVALIWIASFAFPLAPARPLDAKSRFRSYAKGGWLYVLAAVGWSTCAVLGVLLFFSSGLSIAR